MTCAFPVLVQLARGLAADAGTAPRSATPSVTVQATIPSLNRPMCTIVLLFHFSGSPAARQCLMSAALPTSTRDATGKRHW